MSTTNGTRFAKVHEGGNTHGAWIRGEDGQKDKRLAGGSEKHCRSVLDADGRPGYVRELTQDELR